MKKFLVTGLLVWVPLGITIWVLNLTITTMDQTLLLLPEHWQPDYLLPFCTLFPVLPSDHAFGIYTACICSPIPPPC